MTLSEATRESYSMCYLLASRDSDVALSPVYLQRHSRQTRSNSMAPLARGTPLRAGERLKEGLLAAGAKACEDTSK
eukprot:CAMPEP_0178688738 /NCGR_PEP_ID=MMETSP0699-20121125/5155_1 /TAXON_ID=265572 /ORGANISM="Extubocellulus spinifer, Strain CCMP396" /LENGTH=75 /DNA_ID=CAMNT_0020333735 /DNA_START=525 /DNA_END=752 /DNA_ORIENTATION=-